MTADHLAPYPPLPDVAFVAGMGAPDSKIHAIAHGVALIANLNQDTTTDPHRAHTECGTWALVARRTPFSFARGDREFDRCAYRACTECCWRVAIDTGDLTAELAAQIPADNESAAMDLLGVDPRLVLRLCNAVLDQRRDDVGEDTHIPHLLGHLSDHRPTVLLGYDCVDQDCDHDDEDGCYLDTPGVACLTCSLSAGNDQGEYTGNLAPECQVPAPCSVLTTYARTFNVPLTRKAPDAH